MAMRGTALKKVQAALTNLEPFGKNITGASISAEKHPASIKRGQYEGPLPLPVDVQYVVYSYVTPIAWVLHDGTVQVPSQHYSNTTTQHQHQCRLYLPGECEVCGAKGNVFSRKHTKEECFK